MSNRLIITFDESPEDKVLYNLITKNCYSESFIKSAIKNEVLRDLGNSVFRDSKDSMANIEDILDHFS